MKFKCAAFFTIFCVLATIAQANQISYIHSSISLDEVMLERQEWLPFGGEVYEGLDNGVYWFKIDELDSLDEVLSVPNTHILFTKLYRLGSEIDKLSGFRYAVYPIQSTLGLEPYYLKVVCAKEAVIPLKIESANGFHENYGNQNLILGLYYGIVVAVIMLNIFSFISYRSNTYLYYVFMLLSISLGLACRDGFNILLFSDHGVNEYLEPFFNLCVGICCMLFATSYLQLDEYLPGVRKYGLWALLVSIALFLAYLATGSFLVFSITEISILLVLTIYWGVAIYLFRQSMYARFFSIAYGIILFSSYDFYLSPHFGIHGLGLDLGQFRVGAIVEMVVFTFAIAYQGRTLIEENEKVQAEVNVHTQKIKSYARPGHEALSYLMQHFDLTQQEVKVLEGISSGKVNKEIADEFSISVNTVKFHIRNVYKKLEVNSRKEASIKYFEAYR